MISMSPIESSSINDLFWSSFAAQHSLLGRISLAALLEYQYIVSTRKDQFSFVSEIVSNSFASRSCPLDYYFFLTSKHDTIQGCKNRSNGTVSQIKLSEPPFHFHLRQQGLSVYPCYQSLKIVTNMGFCVRTLRRRIGHDDHGFHYQHFLDIQPITLLLASLDDFRRNG